MSASVKIYNNRGQLGIDATYANLACHRVLNADGSLYREYTAQQFADVVHVHELLDATSLGVTRSYSYKHLTNTNEPIFGNLRNKRGGDKDIYGKEYIFGVPMLDKPDSLAGLRIYNPQTKELVFDSRLPYLKIVGVASNGLNIDPTKRYGIITTSPVNFVNKVEKQSYTSASGSELYRYILYDDFDAFCIKDNKIYHYKMIRINNLNVTHMGAQERIYTNTRAKLPYLVDLTGL